MLGILDVHGGYLTLTPSQVATGFLLPGHPEALGTPNSLTNYYLIPTANLLLLDPIRSIPVVGNPIAHLLQPAIPPTWSTGATETRHSATRPGRPTSSRPSGPAAAERHPARTDSISGTQAGVSAFASDISAMAPMSLPATCSSAPNLPLSSLTMVLTATAGPVQALPALVSIPSTLTGIISGIESANTNIVGTLTMDISTAYGTLLPTADIWIPTGSSPSRRMTSTCS